LNNAILLLSYRLQLHQFDCRDTMNHQGGWKVVFFLRTQGLCNPPEWIAVLL
jgi:hypothetical protein